MRKILVCLLAVASVCVQAVHAQHYYFDVSLRIASLVEMNSGYEAYPVLISPATAISGEVIFFFRPGIGVGGFFNQNVIEAKYRGVEQTYGIDSFGGTLQWINSRNRLLQYYGVLRLGQYGREYQPYSQPRSWSSGGSLSAGINIKVGQALRLNVIELGYTRLPEHPELIGGNLLSHWVSAQTGITVNLVKRRSYR